MKVQTIANAPGRKVWTNGKKKKSHKGRKEKREEGTLILRHFTTFNIFIAADSIGIFFEHDVFYTLLTLCA